MRIHGFVARFALLGWLPATLIARGQVPAPTGAKPDQTLLIVAPKEFHEALAGYAAYKSAQLPTAIVELEDVLSSSQGVDDPERLKRFLYDGWRERGVRYVLLVGDADVLPTRYMVLDRVTAPAFDYAFYPSDLYYADLAKPDGSFEDWNGAKDSFHANYFGEVRGEKNKSDPINYDHIDYHPEVAVGRWPVSTPEEVRTVAAKSMAYEASLHSEGATPSEASGAPAPRIGLIAAGGWMENRPMMDSLAAMLPSGWKAEKRYFTDREGGRNDHTPPPDEAQVVAMLNNGVPLIVHSGHGSDDSWAGSIGTGSIAKLRNSAHPAVMLSAGCSTARFATLPPYEAYTDINGKDHAGTNAGEVFTEPPPPPAPYQKDAHNPTGLGEQLLCAGPNGAAAYIGCNTGSQPCGMTLLEGFVGALAGKPGRDPGTPLRLGDCWNAAINHYFDAQHLETIKPDADWYPPSIFFQGMKFMVFGDPSLLIPVASDPQRGP